MLGGRGGLDSWPRLGSCAPSPGHESEELQPGGATGWAQPCGERRLFIPPPGGSSESRSLSPSRKARVTHVPLAKQGSPQTAGSGFEWHSSWGSQESECPLMTLKKQTDSVPSDPPVHDRQGGGHRWSATSGPCWACSLHPKPPSVRRGGSHLRDVQL